MKPPNALLTLAEVATILNRPKAFVARLIREGRLPVANLDGRVLDPHRRGRKDHRIRPEDVQAFIDASVRRVVPPPPPAMPVPKVKVARMVPVVKQPLWDGVDRLAGRGRK